MPCRVNFVDMYGAEGYTLAVIMTADIRAAVRNEGVYEPAIEGDNE